MPRDESDRRFSRRMAIAYGGLGIASLGLLILDGVIKSRQTATQGLSTDTDPTATPAPAGTPANSEAPKLPSSLSLDFSEFLPQIDKLSHNVGMKIRVRVDNPIKIQTFGPVIRSVKGEGFIQVLGTREIDHRNFWMSIRRDIPDDGPRTEIEEFLRKNPTLPKDTVINLTSVYYQLPPSSRSSDVFTYNIERPPKIP